MRTIKIKKDAFWDSAWSSENLKKGTEMLDRLIPHKSVEFSYKLLGDITGKKLLDVGCGSGLLTIELCQKEAFVTAIDVSEESIRATKEVCKKNIIQNMGIKKMNAESLQFKDNTFDRVYISRMLMHTNKDHVLQESIRVLKKGGILVVSEPLKYWMFAFPYRLFSPYRKSNPKYITIKEVKKLNMKHKEFYLFSTFFFFLFYMMNNKKIAFMIFDMFAWVDTLLLKVFPFLRNFAWITVAWLKK